MLDIDYDKFDFYELKKSQEGGYISKGLYSIIETLIDSYITNNLYNLESKSDINMLRKIALSNVKALSNFRKDPIIRFDKKLQFINTVERILIYSEKDYIFIEEKIK